MKTKQTSGYLMVLTTLFLVCIGTFPKNNLFGKQLNKVNPLYVKSSLRLNNSPIDFQFFSTASSGLLTVVAEYPDNLDVTKIPFRAYIKRKGAVVKNGLANNCQSMTEVDIKNVLAVAKPGDWLVIEPIRKEDSAARRTILLKSPMAYLFSFLNKDGC